MPIKAIQTHYQGYLFRSRLEARWACFFTHLGLSWEYEPEGFVIDGLRYLPDFRVTSPQGMTQWYEIKSPRNPSAPKFAAFSAAFQEAENRDSSLRATHCQLLSANDPLGWLMTAFKNDGGVCPRCGALHNAFGLVNAYWDETWFGCDPCDTDTPGGGGHPQEKGLLCNVAPHKGVVIARAEEYRIARTKMIAAATAARSARFEHGESGVRV